MSTIHVIPLGSTMILQGNRGGRFLTKVVTLGFLWGLIIYTVLQFRAIKLDVPMPHLNSRYLLQKRLDTLTRHDSTTEAIDLEPSVDKSPSLSEDNLIQDIQERLPNLPIVYWSQHKNQPMGLNSTCARFPSILDIEFNNNYWQTLKTSNGTFHLFGAYLDKRKNNRLGPTVRILGMIDRIEPTVITHCQFWFDGKKEPVISKSFEYKYVWYKKWGNYKQGIFQPYLIACVIPQAYNSKVPQSISLVEKPCDNAPNNLKVIFNMPRNKKDFAVCVKGLDFLHEDLSVRLVEWIELLNLLGADKIFLYELQVHPNITKVLKHYQQEGKVHVTPITLAGILPNAPALQHYFLSKKTNHKRQNELIPYNDCFYKHMYEYKYIALLDIDEVIMPLEETSWKDLMDKVLKKAKDEKASYNVRNVYFLDDLIHDHGWFKEIPKYMHMMQHVYRTKNFTKPGQYVKCFHNTEKVLTLHNHFPLSCLGSSCTSYAVETGDAQLQHYRADCVKTLKKSCEEFRKTSVMDVTIWKFKEPLIQRVSSTLRTLGFFNNPNNNVDLTGNSIRKR
ncbi:uncharacterized protein LOC126733555 isoform X2 [Anthonomus grandis grandis]|uniref:uncharacterized protein LOC126733555 isoform X2 n=1 Tax=Anthonomus grandis grandis TaxID=2921223 RepID=UPI0021665CA5|nr:uncharacterized protein LOC126733555 isoform X2 [Anthonomus grandis grandis]